MKRGHTPSNWKPEAVTGNEIGGAVMTDQERLEQIQEESITDAIEYGCIHGSRSQVKTDRIVKDVKWLIEQAERAQSVEEENARLRKALAFYAYDSGDYTDKEIAKTALEGEQ